MKTYKEIMEIAEEKLAEYVKDHNAAIAQGAYSEAVRIVAAFGGYAAAVRDVGGPQYNMTFKDFGSQITLEMRPSKEREND